MAVFLLAKRPMSTMHQLLLEQIWPSKYTKLPSLSSRTETGMYMRRVASATCTPSTHAFQSSDEGCTCNSLLRPAHSPLYKPASVRMHHWNVLTVEQFCPQQA